MKFLFLLSKLVYTLGNVSTPYLWCGHYDLTPNGSQTEDSCCPFFKNLFQVISIVNKTDNNGDAIANSLEICTNSTSIKDKTIKCCSICFNKCKMFYEIDQKTSMASFIPSKIENLRFPKVSPDNDRSYLGIQNKTSRFIVTVNLNTVKTVENIVFLVDIDNKNGLKKLFEVDASNLEIIEIDVEDIESLDINVPEDILNTLKEDASIFTWKNFIIALLVYYIVGSLAIIGYFCFFKKPAT
ncbi:uncharacterized protein VICG_01036 [Vittaforma corneae ATCC 50505]|uniref:Niemann-Pick C1 N-terminal domain-containing protein n=1 Tax=Vittaforma corneae (strain ATCC 50505) TaxID=993615 RepID=L2GNF6_VITCO|nr:uncharacterized protein VICG_01036 [Vittaforma corneae ATCC 50505]ELA41852.1 hypothetical protein VICG_01036 [Vittaforma corneae ATCC 50505]